MTVVAPTVVTTATVAQALVSSPSAAAKMAGEAAARSALAAALAAENAAQPGATSSEFKTTMLGIGLAAVYGGLQAFSIIPGPWQLPAVILLAIAGTAGAYATSRGKVKAAALTASATLNAATYYVPDTSPAENRSE